jgi:predicted Rossmann-fold nucleotide-binding protein
LRVLRLRAAGVREDYAQAAEAVGRRSPARWQLVYGGGNVGLMGRVADAALRHGGSGWWASFRAPLLRSARSGTGSSTSCSWWHTMHQRKQMMAERARRLPGPARRHRHAGGALRGLDLAPTGLPRQRHRRC